MHKSAKFCVLGKHAFLSYNILMYLVSKKDMSHQNTNAKNPYNITNDYCHPSEHANALLAVSEAVILNKENTEEVKQKVLEYLVSLGFDEKLAKKEIDAAIKLCVVKYGDSKEKYNKLSLNERKRTTWSDGNF